MDQIKKVFKAGNILGPVAEEFGAALRKQWSARLMQQAWRNHLALIAEDEIGPDFSAIPAKVWL